MKVGFDAKKAIRNHTGIGNYSRRCIQAVKQSGTETQEFYCGIPLLGEIWRNCLQWLSIRKSRVDIYHGLSNELPFGITWSGTKSVVTIHDLIFLRLPETYGWLQRLILNAKTRYACKAADRIVAVSEMTKRDLVNYYRVAPERIDVVYQSISDIYRHTLSDEDLKACAQRYHLPDCYMLCVGTIQERKNQHTLVKSLPLLPGNVHLVLVGKEEAYANLVRQTAEELNVGSRVHIYTGVPSSDLPAFYQLATVFACLSRFEGFGIPLTEALASGLPVIGATGSCLEEAGGPHSIYLSPDDVEGLAQRVNMLLTDKELRETMSKQGKTYSLRFTDEQLGCGLMSIYRSMT